MAEKNRILVTGSQSGIGKYLHEELGGIGFTRDDSNQENLEKARKSERKYEKTKNIKQTWK